MAKMLPGNLHCLRTKSMLKTERSARGAFIRQ
jgi:hypothetical protein